MKSHVTPDARRLYGTAGMKRGVRKSMQPKVAKQPNLETQPIAPIQGKVDPNANPSAPPASQAGATQPPQAQGPRQVALPPPLDPKQTGTEQQAVSYIQTQAQAMIGRQLNPSEMQEAARIAGYDGKGTVTGAQVNAVIGEMARRASGQSVARGAPGQLAEPMAAQHVPNAPVHSPGRVSLPPPPFPAKPPVKPTPGVNPAAVKQPDAGGNVAGVKVAHTLQAKLIPAPPKVAMQPLQAKVVVAPQKAMAWLPEAQYRKQQKGLKKAIAARRKQDKTAVTVTPAFADTPVVVDNRTAKRLNPAKITAPKGSAPAPDGGLSFKAK